jgi:hypothetical protein
MGHNGKKTGTPYSHCNSGTLLSKEKEGPREGRKERRILYLCQERISNNFSDDELDIYAM